MVIYILHKATELKSKQSSFFSPLDFTPSFYLNKRVTQSRLPVCGRVEEWLVKVDFDTIRLSLSFQSNQLCLTITYMFIICVVSFADIVSPTKDILCYILANALPG